MSTAKKRTLNEITEHLQQLLWRIDEAEGVLEDGIEEELDALGVEFKEKANAILWVCDQQEAMASKMKARAKALSAKAKSVERDRERLREYLLRSMLSLGIERTSTKDYPIVAVYKSPDKVEIENETAFVAAHGDDEVLCDEVTTYKPKKTAIKNAILDGEEVVGAVLLRDRKRLGVK